MNRTAQGVLADLQSLPNLRPFVKEEWVEQASQNVWVSSWHPFFDLSSHVMQQLDSAIGYLKERGVDGYTEAAARLTGKTPAKMTWDNFLSGYDEILQAEKLRRGGYDISFIKRTSERTPDLRVELPDGPVCVELTAANRTWRYELLRSFFETKLADINNAYLLRIRTWSDLVVIVERELERDLVQPIRACISTGTDEPGNSKTFVFSGYGERIEVVVISTGMAEYIVEMGTVGDDPNTAFQPGWDKQLGPITEAVKGKREQLEDCDHGVLVVNLVHHSMFMNMIVPLTFNAESWRVIEDAIRSDGIPPEIDAVVCNFGNVAGKVIRNSDWSRHPENQHLLNLLGSQP
jgi:hypothetical protein